MWVKKQEPVEGNETSQMICMRRADFESCFDGRSCTFDGVNDNKR